MISENIEKIHQRIQESLRKAGRLKEEIHLVGVTKNVPTDRILEAVHAGLIHIGENKVQEGQEKYSAIHASAPSLKWHMIGHLQRNKVNRALEIFDCVQSVDSPRLLETIDRRAKELNKIQDCLVELKISAEPNKFGVLPENLPDFLKFCRSFENVRVLGIMTMAPYSQDPQQARPYFSKARALFEKCFPKESFSGSAQPILSMGMSSDFEVALEEGSNMIRIGTAIFGERLN